MPCKRQMKVVVTWSSLIWQLTFIVFQQRINSAAWDPLTNLLNHTTTALVFLRREIAVKHCILLHLFSRRNFGSRRIFGWNCGSTDSKKVMLSMASWDFFSKFPVSFRSTLWAPKNHGTLHPSHCKCNKELAHKNFRVHWHAWKPIAKKNWRCASVPELHRKKTTTALLDFLPIQGCWHLLVSNGFSCHWLSWPSSQKPLDD